MLPKSLLFLFTMVLEAISARRDARLRFLREQVVMLKARVPGNRVILRPDERKILLRLGSLKKPGSLSVISLIGKTFPAIM